MTMTGIESSANYGNAFMVVPMENPGPPNYEKPKTSTEEDTPKKVRSKTKSEKLLEF